MTTTESQRCPECGHERPRGVSAGLCPVCALPAQTEPPALTAVKVNPGDVIGRYKLLQKIGEGAMGDVWMAQQEEPIHRKVALKVVKLGLDTRQVIARFEAELQALALMDHPNIAKVLDAGATETGRPYFVMELVRGMRITDYCDQHKLTTRARLDLFMQVCHAIQHAHQKGIIHRDIKPSNIKVTLHDGVPKQKVIDYGIAKATTGQRLTDKTLFTAYEQFMGTPAYMSPEQAEMSGLDIDTRSDIYSQEQSVGGIATLVPEFIARGPQVRQKFRQIGIRHLDPRQHPAVIRARVCVMEETDIPAAAERAEKLPQRAGAFRELQAIKALVLQPGGQPTHHVPQMQLRHLVVAQVGHGVAEFLQTLDDLRALIQPAGESNADENSRPRRIAVAVVEFRDVAVADRLAECPKAAGPLRNLHGE
jgi:hypothetical protein